ncbi:MAG: type I restriction enzyme HsdR N-terminal domain-containing protein [Methanobrevibacter sp.]|uniref:type I restriction endonuclease n=1 Tax=Methanobrevibacter sp. TaxID=66852 RepID=UPI002E781759|nr:type I restriction endonuclease [Methanobrevibacter sp.]MEE0935313.1 type I restriction enzyme HsdR N-terminal domain-containing protein [Methanobrevibacter sp.]
MTFEDELVDFTKNLASKRKGISTEETTKIALILPFIRLLGYDIENPDELKAEYVADTGVKKREKIDLAVCIDGEAKMLVECKPANVKLNTNHFTQLFRYFSVSDVKIAILTNGTVYWFFTDYDNPGRMDEKPFLEIDLRNLTESKIESLKLFEKANFSVEKIMEHVEELKYRQAIHETILNEIKDPTDEMVKVIAKQSYSEIMRKPLLEYFRKLVKEELRDVFENNYDIDSSDIITTEEEREGFYIVRAILSEIIDTSRVTMRDRISYCGILFDDNNRYPICRLYFNDLDNMLFSLYDFSIPTNKPLYKQLLTLFKSMLLLFARSKA